LFSLFLLQVISRSQAIFAHTGRIQVLTSVLLWVVQQTAELELTGQASLVRQVILLVQVVIVLFVEIAAEGVVFLRHAQQDMDVLLEITVMLVVVAPHNWLMACRVLHAAVEVISALLEIVQMEERLFAVMLDIDAVVSMVTAQLEWVVRQATASPLILNGQPMSVQHLLLIQEQLFPASM
jgi:hypothetical protein